MRSKTEKEQQWSVVRSIAGRFSRWLGYSAFGLAMMAFLLDALSFVFFRRKRAEIIPVENVLVGFAVICFVGTLFGGVSLNVTDAVLFSLKRRRMAMIACLAWAVFIFALAAIVAIGAYELYLSGKIL